MMRKNKKGFGDFMKPTMTILGVVIGVIVIFYLIGGLASTLTDASTQISGSGLPLASLFSNTGVLFTLFMLILFVGIIIVIVKMAKGK
jgi:hypothetical protein